MLESNKFDEVSTLLDGHPNIINSMRTGEDELTLMMHAATKHHKDCIEFLSKKPHDLSVVCLLYTSPSPRDKRQSRMPSSA